MATPTPTLTLDQLASLCKRRGFIYPSSEIYGGLNGFWDYGPLGAELKRNLKEAWWASMTRFREDVVGLDATIIMHPDIWRASGHADGFADPMVDCRSCKKRFRADQLCAEQGKELIKTETGSQLPAGTACTACGSKDLTEPRAFNLMFKSFVGPVEDAANTVFLRPETAQAIFAGANKEFPANPKAPVSEEVASWGSFKADTIPVEVAGKRQAEAIRLMDRVGWR